MTDQRHFNRIKLANQLPLNQAARKLLPPGWQNEMSLHVLNLMQWGIWEGGIRFDSRPYQEAVEARLLNLENREPRLVMKLLVDPELAPGTFATTALCHSSLCGCAPTAPLIESDCFQSVAGLRVKEKTPHSGRGS